MALIEPNVDHLTRDGTSTAVDLIHVGMAYLAGTGPSGKTCFDCRSHSWRGRSAFGRCRKFTEMTGKKGPSFTGTAAACKYFSARAE